MSYQVAYWVRAARQQTRHIVQGRKLYRAETGTVRGSMVDSVNAAKRRRKIFMTEARRLRVEVAA